MPCFQCVHIPQGQEGRVIEKENLLDHLKCCISVFLRCREKDGGKKSIQGEHL